MEIDPPYYNYKSIIQDMVNEDNILLEKLHELVNNIIISDNDNHSEDEI